MAIVAAVGISAGVSAYGAYSASKASKKAAAAQSDAANRAMALQTSQYNQGRSDLQPYQQLGQQGINEMNALNASLTPWTGEAPSYNPETFTAPTALEAAAEPGVRMMQTEAQRAIEQSAAARGTALGGNTMAALQDRSAGIASQAYGDVYNRAQNTYATNAQQAWQAYQARYAGNQADKATFYESQDRPYSRAANNAQMGYGATQLNLGLGQNYANNTGSLLTQQGNVNAAGIIGSNNAVNQGLYSVSGDVTGGILAKDTGQDSWDYQQWLKQQSAYKKAGG